MTLSLKGYFRIDLFQILHKSAVKIGEAGNAMLEFAFLAPVFFSLFCGVFEVSGIILTQTLLEGGARQASRYGVTGSVSGDISRQARILQIIEDNAYGMIDVSNVSISTLTYKNFGDVGQAEPFTDANGNGILDEDEEFDDINENGGWDDDMGVPGMGGSEDVVVYHLSYDWQLILPILAPFLGEEITLVASIAVRNEPFDSG